VTAHELARKLLEGPDVLVLVRGYEGGYDAASVPETKSVMHQPDASWFYGRYDEPQDGDTVIEAVLV
jgi:hypothetical protein